MNAAVVPFRLLIIHDSQQEAQRLSSMFQNAGRPCRAQHIQNEDALNKVIEEQSWDLAIAHSAAQTLTPATTIRAIRKYNHDLPVIILADEEDGGRSVVDGLKLGAKDVVRLDDDQHLLLVVSRELENRQQRKNTRTAERKLKEVERRNRQLLDSSKDGIAFIQDGMFIYANDSFAEMCGYDNHDDIEYAPIMDMVNSDDQESVKKSLKTIPLKDEEDGEQRLAFHIKSADGGYVRIDSEAKVGQFEEESCIQLILHADVSGNEQLEAEIASIKQTDSATGLANKNQFYERLSRLIAESSDNETAHSLFYIEIDQFKEKVESLVGIDGTEQALKIIAQFIKEHTQPKDFLARVGDHAFAIISNEVHMEKLLSTGNVLCELIREHFFEIKQKTLRLTVSIGITTANETSIDAQSVINQAAQAITDLRDKKKSDAGDGANIFQNSDDDKTVLVSSLQKALSENRFRLLFQPIVSLRGDETERYEVLLRMLDENDAEVSPSHFLQTAESMQIVTKIDRWVLLETIKHLSNHHKQKGSTQLLINISRQTLCDESLIPWLSVAFKAAKVDPSLLTLQVRESDAEQHLTAAKKFVEHGSSMGLGFCLSQFGCSLNPMELLNHIDIDQIKIDGSFSIELQDNPNNAEAISQLLETLKEREKIIIVPMIENASVLSKLWKMGVHCIQGNYLQPPGMAMDYEFGVESAS